MIHLLLYAEQPLVQHAICALLVHDDKLSLTTTNCIETFNASIADTQYHAILFATKAGGANSMEQISATLEQTQPTTKLILLLDQDDPCCLNQLLTKNISGYFIKDNIDASLPHLVRAIVAGKVIYSRGVVRKLVSTDASTSFDYKTIGLTEREWEVAKLMAQGWPNPKIAAELSLTQQTVRNKVSRIYAKVGVASRPEFLFWAQEQGLRVM